MSNQYPRARRFVSEQVWAIKESTLDTIVEVLRMRSAGIQLTKEEIQARIGTSERPQARSNDAVAVLPLHGVIAPRMNMMVDISGGTSIDQFMSQYRAFRDDPSVTAIVCDVDSPGGSVFMLREAFDEIYASRSAKPQFAVVNPTCASAAYYLACAFPEIVCTPSGEVGSVGALMLHEDWSKANEMMGIKPTYIHYGKYKVEGNEDEPLDEEAEGYFQSLVDEFGEDFVRAVAKGRGKTVAEVRANFGQGRVLLGRQAVQVGMVDRLDSFDRVLSQLVGRRSRSVSARAFSQDFESFTQSLTRATEQLKTFDQATRQCAEELRAEAESLSAERSATPEVSDESTVEQVIEGAGVEHEPATESSETAPVAETPASFPYERAHLERELELLERL